MGVQHNVVLNQTNIRWFSRGHVLTRVFEFRDEIMLVFCEKSNNLCEIFESREFVISLAFLADIFSHLNDLNIKMQGTGVTVMNTGEEINAFVQKLALWKRKGIKTILQVFLTWIIYLKSNRMKILAMIRIYGDIITQLENMMEIFTNYFKDTEPNLNWI